MISAVSFLELAVVRLAAEVEETTRSDLSYSSSNIAFSSRRPVQLAPYKPKGDLSFMFEAACLKERI